MECLQLAGSECLWFQAALKSSRIRKRGARKPQIWTSAIFLEYPGTEHLRIMRAHCSPPLHTQCKYLIQGFPTWGLQSPPGQPEPQHSPLREVATAVLATLGLCHCHEKGLRMDFWCHHDPLLVAQQKPEEGCKCIRSHFVQQGGLQRGPHPPERWPYIQVLFFLKTLFAVVAWSWRSLCCCCPTLQVPKVVLIFL